MPFLIDMKIFYALLKMSYGASYAPWHVHLFFLGHPLIHGVWHPYKDCVEMTYSTFTTNVKFLEQGWDLKVGVVVPLKAKLRTWRKQFLGCCLPLLPTRLGWIVRHRHSWTFFRDLCDVQRVGLRCLSGLKALLYFY